jgi:uncharacterized BrkB/YihY/UPF0761 family membrane protein
LSLFTTEEKPRLWTRTVRYWSPTARYCLQTEAHVYALAVAASVLLSFYPFLILMLAFCKNVLHSTAARDTILLALGDYFPGELGNFLKYNLGPKVVYVGNVPLMSMLLLLFTVNGVFEPLEVAFNRLWGVAENRSYLKNQLVALGLAFLCGSLALISIIMTAMNQVWASRWAVPGGQAEEWINRLIFKLAALPISILALFFVYWLLPNRRIAAVKVVPVAILVGLSLEGLKYVYLMVWGWLGAKLAREYGVFQHSVGILLWSFVAALIILAGAEWAARREMKVTQ